MCENLVSPSQINIVTMSSDEKERNVFETAEQNKEWWWYHVHFVCKDLAKKCSTFKSDFVLNHSWVISFVKAIKLISFWHSSKALLWAGLRLLLLDTVRNCWLSHWLVPCGSLKIASSTNVQKVVLILIGLIELG